MRTSILSRRYIKYAMAFVKNKLYEEYPIYIKLDRSVKNSVYNYTLLHNKRGIYNISEQEYECLLKCRNNYALRS